MTICEKIELAGYYAVLATELVMLGAVLTALVFVIWAANHIPSWASF